MGSLVKKAPAIIKKDTPKNLKLRITRSGGPKEIRKIPKYVMRKPLTSNRFQRIRSFLDNPGPREYRNRPLQMKKISEKS